MKSTFSGKDIGFSQPRKTTRGTVTPQYFVFTEIEFVSLVFCIILDIIEYVAAILTMPVIGDLLDVVGILFCFVIFRWIGLVSLVELVPGADVFPVFIITWLVWYFLRKQKIATRKRHHPRVHTQ
ncbi:MAG: hypothetical protein NWE80_00040 [Candidatus Bathyarchaeota archaeon]|nr:hypothetical protein [Candidatus Bathyarchaeota archaeon]